MTLLKILISVFSTHRGFKLLALKALFLDTIKIQFGAGIGKAF